MIITEQIELSTKGFSDIIDITGTVSDVVKRSRVADGLVTVAIVGSTAGVTTIEYEPGIMKDLQNTLEKIAPSNRSYFHDRAWGDGNGFSHIRASLLGASKSFIIRDKKILLGTWQQIIVVDCDNRPRSRTVAVQVIGE